MSFTTTLFPIIAALSAPENTYFNLNNNWTCVNKNQTYFIEHFFDKKSELAQFEKKELQSWVSHDHNFLNRTAQEHGFTIQLEPFHAGEFGALSILDIAVQWVEKGSITSIYHKNNCYKATYLEKNFSVYETEEYTYPIARIETQSNDVVYITQADIPLQEFTLLQKIRVLQDAVATAQSTPYEHITFPHVKLNHEVDISWLLGMYCADKNSNENWYISQAKQQTKFAMDESGAHVQSAVAVGFMRCICAQASKELIIDQPFYIWIERPDCSIPIFAGYIDSSNWVVAE